MANVEKQAKKRDGVPLNLRIEPSIKLAFKVWCASHQIEMTDVVSQAIEAVLSGKFKPHLPKQPSK